MYEFKIYGEIVPFNDKDVGKDGAYCNLSFVQSELTKANGKPIKVRINSVGGDVVTGFQIYHELRSYASKHNVKVITVGEAYVASIATIIFLAGDERILTGITAPFFHYAWSEIAGNSDDLTKQADELLSVTKQMAVLYSNITELTYSEAMSLMKSNTSLSTEEAISIKFAHRYEEPSRPKALVRFAKSNINNKSKKEMSIKQKPVIIAKALAFLKSFSMAKMMNTANSESLEFPELGEDDTPKVGDFANLDGEPAEGEIDMPSGEVYVFEGGILEEIREYEEEETEEILALKAKVEEYETILASSANTIKAMKAKIDGYESVTGKRPSNTPANAKKPVSRTNAPQEKGSRSGKAMAFALNPKK